MKKMKENGDLSDLTMKNDWTRDFTMKNIDNIVI